MAGRRRAARSDRELAPQDALTRHLTEREPQWEMDFTEAPIFKIYGPSATMVQQERWRNGATIPTRQGVLRRGGNTQPRTAKQRENGRSRKHK